MSVQGNYGLTSLQYIQFSKKTNQNSKTSVKSEVGMKQCVLTDAFKSTKDFHETKRKKRAR